MYKSNYPLDVYTTDTKEIQLKKQEEQLLKQKTEQELTSPLYEEIGRLKMELDWLKKNLPVSGRDKQI